MNIKRFKSVVVIILLLPLSGCGRSSLKADLSTPEGAILSLEEAYRQGDIEKAVACKDFKLEAAHMIQTLPHKQEIAGDDTLKKLAEVLELAFRAEMKKGFPDFKGVTSTFPKKRDLGDSMVAVTEVCRYPKGGTSKQDIMVAKTEAGWKVMIPIN